MKKGFTLAETLITLGIIGVVAAITIPTLISNYQKHVYYTQFMKARSTIENALRLYANDHDCSDSEPLCNPESGSVAIDFARYFNGARIITDSNAPELCKGYNKLPIRDYKEKGARTYDPTGYDSCQSCQIFDFTPNNGIITIDGILINFNIDTGDGSCSLVDTNGPDAGPNLFGRDIFYFCLGPKEDYCNNPWGMTKECLEQKGHTNRSNCFGIGSYGNDGGTCGARLIKEGKMTY